MVTKREDHPRADRLRFAHLKMCYSKADPQASVIGHTSDRNISCKQGGTARRRPWINPRDFLLSFFKYYRRAGDLQ